MEVEGPGCAGVKEAFAPASLVGVGAIVLAASGSMVLAGSLVYTGRVGGAGGLVEPGDAGAPLQLASKMKESAAPKIIRLNFNLGISGSFPFSMDGSTENFFSFP